MSEQNCKQCKFAPREWVEGKIPHFLCRSALQVDGAGGKNCSGFIPRSKPEEKNMEIRLTRQSVASPLFLALFDEAVALHLAADVEPGDSELEEQIKRQRQITHLSELIKQLSDMLEYVYAVSDFDDINDEHGD